MSDVPAAARWRDELAGWAIPEQIAAQAPEPPWGFPAELFPAAPREAADTPSRRRALDALPEGGSVLDVGCGGGAGGLSLVPPAAYVVGVDSGEHMLSAFATAAHERGVRHREVHGDWPAVAAAFEPADVAVCHHVLYNVPDLATFALALSKAARRRVVVELTARHPLADTRAMWRHFHGVDRPVGPSAALAVDTLREAGLTPKVEEWTAPPREVPRAALVALNRRRLCLSAEQDPVVDRLLGPPVERRLVTLWWDVG